MRKSFIFSLVLLSATWISAQENPDTSYWTKGGLFKVDMAQSSFTNWSAGGINAINANSLLSTYAKYQKGKVSWDNTLDLSYGLLRQKPSRDSVTLIKSDDKIDLNSKLGYRACEYWNYAGFLSFKTQFDEGFNYPNTTDPISRFLAPAYLIFGVGMDFKPNKDFSLLLSPLTGKLTMVNDDSLSAKGAYGVEPGNTTRTELGGYVKASYRHDLMENISFQTKVDLFSNYLHNPQNIDVNWEVLIAMKVNKFVTVTLGTHLIYDDDIKIKVYDDSGKNLIGEGPRTQFKEVLGVGFSYKF